ncbi:MAG: PAS domain-containing protein, partial [Gemmataceae bacterium]
MSISEAELRQSELVLRQLAESIGDCFYLLNLDPLHCEYCSPGYEAIWGRPVQAVYDNPMDWMQAVLPEDLPVLQAGFEAGIRGEARVDEYRIRRPDGAVRWLRARCFPVRDAAGKVYRIAGIIEDITERRRTEAALRDSEEQNRLINETVPGGLIIFDEAGTIIRANAQAADLIGIPVADLLGKTTEDFDGMLFREDGAPIPPAETPVGRCLSTGLP